MIGFEGFASNTILWLSHDDNENKASRTKEMTRPVAVSLAEILVVLNVEKCVLVYGDPNLNAYPGIKTLR